METGDWRLETGDWRREIGDRRLESGTQHHIPSYHISTEKATLIERQGDPQALLLELVGQCGRLTVLVPVPNGAAEGGEVRLETGDLKMENGEWRMETGDCRV
eukprot:101383-Rhodomonas_salina.4